MRRMYVQLLQSLIALWSVVEVEVLTLVPLRSSPLSYIALKFPIMFCPDCIPHSRGCQRWLRITGMNYSARLVLFGICKVPILFQIIMVYNTERITINIVSNEGNSNEEQTAYKNQVPKWTSMPKVLVDCIPRA